MRRQRGFSLIELLVVLAIAGLMTGLAGIGYQLLRLAEPRCVPSVLRSKVPRIVPALSL